MGRLEGWMEGWRAEGFKDWRVGGLGGLLLKGWRGWKLGWFRMFKINGGSPPLPIFSRR